MRVRRVRLIAERLLFVIGGALLGYWVYEQVGGSYFEWRENRRFEQQRARRERVRAMMGDSTSIDDPHAWVGLRPGTVMGRIAIPRVNVAAVIVRGVEPPDLLRAVGHFPETPFFGQGGNVSLAGHRDRHFSGLRNLTLGDTIAVETVNDDFLYVVDSLFVVSPTAVEVLDPTGSSTLTLVTCYPFDFVGPAPHRFIVRAEQIAGPGTQMRGNGRGSGAREEHVPLPEALSRQTSGAARRAPAPASRPPT